MNSIAAALRIEDPGNGARTLVIEGRLDASSSGTVWREARKAVRAPGELIVDASGVTYWDLSGIGLLVDLHRRQARPASHSIAETSKR